MIWSQVGFSNGALMDGPIPMHIWATKIEQDINFVRRSCYEGQGEAGGGKQEWMIMFHYIHARNLQKIKKYIIKSLEMLNIRFTK